LKKNQPISANWFDPRTGIFSNITDLKEGENLIFDPPEKPELDNDWVLVLKM
jgi:hypothetical protein